MLVVTALNNLVRVSMALDEVKTSDPEQRKLRLEQALEASSRIAEDLLKNDDLDETLRQARAAIAPYAKTVPLVVADSSLFRAFLQAERRLFNGLGLDSSIADRLMAMIRDVGPLVYSDVFSAASPNGLLKQIEKDAKSALKDLKKVDMKAVPQPGDEIYTEGEGVLSRIFFVVGGTFTCGANALVGAGTLPVTSELSIVGAAVSASIGVGLVYRQKPD